MKVFGGYFLGVMEDKKKSNDALETMTRSHGQIWLASVALRNHFNIICLLNALRPYISLHRVPPLLFFRFVVRKLKHQSETKGGGLYVCNHRTLLDPLCLSFSLQKDLTTVTYSLSRVSELLAPIKTVRLSRDRDRDGKMLRKLLKQGDLVVCPEGTTCREPYLLRFSPLFAEMSDYIIPDAMDSHVSMFYGTTAGGLKCLDPLFFTMNPRPSYKVQVLAGVSGLTSCDDDGERSRFDVANHVQSEIGKALGFGCTRLTRRDKYLILVGNEGIVNKP
ncbi:Glycerol-3-phosphate acyltransferase 7 [Hibiscus syriacus]|uniref:Glycerol-3-phosphate acyltransferase 7 n=1 Tax=Hibiscus syriacus TaxID=106335 RepID=A0A6A3BGW4_HIBSY|nr:Glycerol-3-phosphate acyltransferase 7 [Hibiscus syriacus]